MSMQVDDAVERAAQWLRDADALLVTAGAGMGVDSGLPDFRGNQGFWRAYPALSLQSMRFSEIASPSAFHETPGLAWGFYGHRLGIYRRTEPMLVLACCVRGATPCRMVPLYSPAMSTGIFPRQVLRLNALLNATGRFIPFNA